MFDLNSFRNIAGSEKSIGFVGIGDDNKTLTKLDAHRHRTGLNTDISAVNLAGREVKDAFKSNNHALRQELLRSLGSMAVKDDFKTYAARMLGIDPKEVANRTELSGKPLERRVIRDLIALADRVAGTGRASAAKLNGDAKTLDRFMRDPAGTARSLPAKDAIELYRALRELKASGFAVLRLGSAVRYETASTDDTEAQLEALEERFFGDDGDFSIEPKFLETFTKAIAAGREGVEDHSLEAMRIRKMCAQIVLKAGEGKISATDLATLTAPRLRTIVEWMTAKPEPLTGSERLKATVDDYKNTNAVNSDEVQANLAAFEEAADEVKEKVKIFGKEVVKGSTRAKEAPAPQPPKAKEGGSFFGNLFGKIGKFVSGASKTLTAGAEVQALAKADDAAKAESIRAMMADLISEEDSWVVDDLRNKLTAEGKGPKEVSAAILKHTLLKHSKTLALVLCNNLEDIKKLLNPQFADMLEAFHEQIMDNIPSSLKEMLKPGNEAAVVGTIHMLLNGGKMDEVLQEIPGQIHAVVKNVASKIQSEFTTNFLNMIASGKSKGAQNGTDNKVEGYRNVKQMILEEAKDLRDKYSVLFEEEPKPLKEGERGPDGKLVTGDQAWTRKNQIAKYKADYAKANLEASRELLERLGGDAATDFKNGYGKFMMTVMEKYFTAMSPMDMASFVSAGIRYADKGASEIGILGAMLKGAGPLMHKMLQGLANAQIPDEFKVALEDIRSKLKPIPETIVKANLLDMINRSNGKIESITVEKSLGAASVAQTFLCKMKLKGEAEPRNVVVKMLRPDIEARIDREKQIFIEASKAVPGMEVTFAGQLESILEELDLRNEAANTKSGQVYSTFGDPNVKAMKLLDIVPPTKYTMLAEYAEGTTLDRYVADVGDKIATLKTRLNAVTTLRDSSDRRSSKLGNADVAETFAVLNELKDTYEKLLQHQKRLIGLTDKWATQGIFKLGYFHGDLHDGNIMVSDNQLTVLDFGNATKLTKDQQKYIIRMMMAASVKDTNRFMDGFKALMTDAGRQVFEDKKKQVHDLIHNIFNLGTEADSASRIFAVLQKLMQMNLELPAPIFKFAQCTMRLQGAVNVVNDKLREIRETIRDFGKEHYYSVSGGCGMKTDANATLMTTLFAFEKKGTNLGSNALAIEVKELEASIENKYEKKKEEIDLPSVKIGKNIFEMATELQYVDDPKTKNREIMTEDKIHEVFLPKLDVLSSLVDESEQGKVLKEKITALRTLVSSEDYKNLYKTTREKCQEAKNKLETTEALNSELHDKKKEYTNARHVVVIERQLRKFKEYIGPEKTKMIEADDRFYADFNRLFNDKKLAFLSDDDLVKFANEAEEIRFELEGPQLGKKGKTVYTKEDIPNLREESTAISLFGGLISRIAVPDPLYEDVLATYDKYKNEIGQIESRQAELEKERNSYKKIQKDALKELKTWVQNHIQPVLDELSAAYDKLYLARLKSYLEQLVPIDKALTDSGIEDFSDVIGKVILDHKGDAIKDVGLINTIVTSFKLSRDQIPV